MPALQPGAAHPCPYPFDDEVAFQFRDGADDDDDGPSQRATGIEVLPKTYELDLQMVEFIQHFEEVPDGSSDSVRGPHQDHLEPAAAGIPKQIVEARPASLGPGDAIGVLDHDLKTALLCHRAEVMKLGSQGAGPQWIRADTEQPLSYLNPSIEARTSRK